MKNCEKKLQKLQKKIQLLEQMIEDQTRDLFLSEQQAREKTKMAALGEMAGGIAHEINNPLGTISIRASQIKRLITKAPLEKDLIINFADIIETTVQRIAKIVQGLRSFARDADNDPLIKVSVQKIFDDTLCLCEAKLTQNGIDVKTELPEDSLVIDCRPIQISQVLLNLIHNAADAIGPLTDKWIKLTVKISADFIDICVMDSGKGISKDISEKIFNPFFTTKDVGKGTGLGLSIAKRIIENHGGTLFIDMTSTNTCFVMRLPC